VIWLALLALATWLYLIVGRGLFWACLDTDFDPPAKLANWPEVVAVVPARDEAGVIARSLNGLLAQDYPGAFHIVLVDDESADATAQIARARPGAERLTVLSGAPAPSGWTDKPWALSQGVRFARENFAPRYLLLTDADILHDPGNLRALVARAEAGGYGLVSLMALLRCEDFAERLLIPAFVYFFQLLYPFRWLRDKRRRTAAAAGGCMLFHADLLAAAGGIEAIRGALIDDCALARNMRTVAPIWLGLTRSAVSLRGYPAVGDIGAMISRSAYAQLKFSPLRLIATLAGMTLAYLAPIWLALAAPGMPGVLGALAFGLMAASFLPINRFYGLSRARSALLPLIAAIYMLYTLKSALDYYRGRGGMWKGRAQANVGKSGEA
jgi:hopene-associated glycosyltransferase HpnB